MPEHLNDRIAEAVRLINGVEELVRGDRPRSALELAEQALRACEGLPDRLRAAALHARGRAHDALGELDAAVADLERARDLEPLSPARWMFLAQLAASRGEWAESRTAFRTAIEVANTVGEREAIPQAHWELAGIARALGEADVAREELSRAMVVADELGDEQSAAYAELALAELVSAQGDREGARGHFARVRATADRLRGGGERQVTIEPGAPATPEGTARAHPLPAPPDDDPVLRVVAAPRLGERVELELWAGDGSEPQRRVVPFRFAVHPRTEERLRWYIEDYAERPVDPAPAIAAEVEEELERLGVALFDSILGGPEAETITAQLSHLTDRLRVEIVADTPAADALPWELLRDPRAGADLALAARALTRTTSAAAAVGGAERDDAAVRVLIVIARPEGRLDVGFRSVADPLLRELTASGASVEVDVLRPPTFERLREVLREAAAVSRPYDLVHFDGHGEFDSEAGVGALVFESGDEAGALVTGAMLGKELNAGAVPLLVMNACRSAAGHREQAYGSVAREALERGLTAVVAMRFNVYVAAAALFVGGLYRALGEGRELQDAVTEARRLLSERPDRGGLPAIQDWCVPVLYQAAPVRLAGAGASGARPATERALPPEPGHGFVGRDEVFVELEAEFVRSPTVVLRALGGAGKTTLATEFARWYVRTGGCGVAGPRISLADRLSAAEVRNRLGPLENRPLVVWDDSRELTAEHVELLDEVAAQGGRTLVVRDRRPDPPGVPVIAMPNFPGEEAQALAYAVALEAGMELTHELADYIGGGLRGHALAIVLAVRELARHDSAITDEALESLFEDLTAPPNGDPAAWTRPLGEHLDVDDAPRDATLVAQCRGYVSAIGLGHLRGDQDYDAAAEALDALAVRGLLTHVGFAAFAIHPGLAVALAAQGRYEPPGRAFAQAMAATGSAWAGFAELEGGDAPWPAEASNIIFARRLASREGWWPEVVQLIEGVVALSMHGVLPDAGRLEILEAAQDFVDLDTGEPLPGMEEYARAFPQLLAGLAEMDGDRAKALRLRTADVAARRARAVGALAVPPDRRSPEERDGIRRLAVGLTNLGPAQSDRGEPGALDTMDEAIQLARDLGDWRLEAQNLLNRGVHWMTVPAPPAFDRADEEFEAGYKLTIEPDPRFAGKFMTERGTVYYERAMATPDAGEQRKQLERAAQLLELAVGLREPDSVLFHQLGQVHRFLGNLEESRAWFEQTIAVRDAEREPGAGADARLHLALTLEQAGLLAEALRYALSAEEVLAEALEPDPALQLRIEEAVARLALLARASPSGPPPEP